MAMSRGVAEALLGSLLTRLDARPKDGPLTMEITPQEADALRALLGIEPPPAAVASKLPDPPSKPTFDWAEYAATPIKTHRLCIDFGTAFSKVALVGNYNRDIKPLNIGKYAPRAELGARARRATLFWDRGAAALTDASHQPSTNRRAEAVSLKG